MHSGNTRKSRNGKHRKVKLRKMKNREGGPRGGQGANFDTKTLEANPICAPLLARHFGQSFTKERGLMQQVIDGQRTYGSGPPFYRGAYMVVVMTFRPIWKGPLSLLRHGIWLVTRSCSDDRALVGVIDFRHHGSAAHR